MVGKSDIDGIEPSRQQDMYILRSLAQKGRLRTLSSSLESRKFNSQKIRQRNVRVGCIVSAPFMAYAYNISWRGLLALLILWGGNARARDWDKQVQNPTSFFMFLISTCESKINNNFVKFNLIWDSELELFKSNSLFKSWRRWHSLSILLMCQN